MLDDPIPALKQRQASAILEEIGHISVYISATQLGLDQPRMWELEHGRLDRFSVQKLIRILARINRRVDVTIIAIGPVPKAWGNRET